MSKIVIGAFAVIGLVMVMPLLGVFVGAFAGWVVGLFFTDTIFGFLQALGADTSQLSMWQIGAAMGFFGGFLKTNPSQSNS